MKNLLKAISFAVVCGLAAKEGSNAQSRSVDAVKPLSSLNDVTFEHISTEQGPSTGTIYCIVQDQQGFLWLGTANGLLRYDGYEFEAYKHHPADSNSISGNHVWSICEDRNGDLWVGTSGRGLNRYIRSEDRFIRYQHDPNDSTSLAGDYEVPWIYEDAAGEIWIALWELGLDHYRLESSHVPSADGISSLLVDRTGILWVGTVGAGLYYYAPEKRKFSHYRYHSGQHSVFVDALCESSDGSLWIGTSGNGLYRLNLTPPVNGLLRLDNATSESLPDKTVLSNGANTFTVYKPRADDRSTISGPNVISIAEDAKGNLWFGTWGEGLNHFDRASNKFTRYTSAEGLPNDIVYGILPDDQGNLWISTNHGLAKLVLSQGEGSNSETGTWEEYDVIDGVQSTEFRRGACHKGRSGRFYFGGINGFNAFYPERIRNNPHVPPVVITDFLIFNKSVQAGPASPLKKAISQTDHLTLSYKQNVFSFEFAALDYTSPQKNRYAYILEGFHENWIDLGPRRFVTFTNLDAGEYVFRVKASNNDGVWNEEGASIKIRITPPSWKTWWAYAIYAGLFVGALLLLRRYELNKVREKNKLREAQLRAETAEFKAKALEAEKEVEKQQIRHRIAADLHDEIGSNLSSIALLSETLQNQSEINGEFRSYFADIHQAARSSTEAVRDIVWFVNPGSDQLSDLIARMEAAARSMLANISYELQRPASLSSAKLNPEVKRNLYLIFKEILANVIKHSRASLVKIEIQEEAGNLALRIEDDGVGFTPLDNLVQGHPSRKMILSNGVNAAASSSGRGLINLRERAAQIGGQLTIQTAPGKGTHVALNAKIT